MCRWIVFDLIGNTVNFSTTPPRISSVLAFPIYQNQCVARQRALAHLGYAGHLLHWQWRLWLESLLDLEIDDWGLESEFYECFVAFSFND